MAQQQQQQNQKKKKAPPPPPPQRVTLARIALVCLSAPADGVAPSLLLSVRDHKGRQLSQYLFNAPEGISRLMLEHQTRPGRCLRALFLSGCSPSEAGGLGGLVLRLKQDGHAALQLVGPPGGGARFAKHTFGLMQQHGGCVVCLPQHTCRLRG